MGYKDSKTNAIRTGSGKRKYSLILNRSIGNLPRQQIENHSRIGSGIFISKHQSLVTVIPRIDLLS
ncbi:MAG TPA: hypothetical protein VK553_05170 [Candidatus Nitrosopolaris rasttigaisensis]|nr:hypothetical protein [Candidatus Nitrosopolaris rasttigaisensis]